jgi:hypothetical protein
MINTPRGGRYIVASLVRGSAHAPKVLPTRPLSIIRPPQSRVFDLNHANLAHEARRTNDKCEGRKSYSEAKPELVALAKQLRRELPRPSLRDISDALFARGYATPLGKPYSASAVQSMLG